MTMACAVFYGRKMNGPALERGEATKSSRETSMIHRSVSGYPLAMVMVISDDKNSKEKTRKGQKKPQEPLLDSRTSHSTRRKMFSTRLILVAAVAAGTVFAEDEKSGETTPQFWRAILGDICQLPSFPRATGDPNRYVECVRQSSFSADRNDLGIWLLRECLPGYEFVASARRCKTIRSVARQQELCNSANATSYQFCPPQTASQFLVEEIREAPRQCTCPNGEANCVCPSPEILEPVHIPINSGAVRRSPQSIPRIQFNQYPSCPCPQSQPQCACVANNAQNEQVLLSVQCCNQQQPQQQQPQQQQPCQCQQPPVNCQTTTTQQQYCPQQQQAVVQPQACPLVQGGVQNAQYQGICSWMVDPLAVDPQSRTHYLQCQPAPNNLFCGRWQRMPCAPGTMFDVSAQVCVWDTQGQPGGLPTPAPYVPTQAPQNSQCSCTGGVQIGSCNQNYQCPGQSVCQVGQNSGQQCMVCCYFRKKSRRV